MKTVIPVVSVQLDGSMNVLVTGANGRVGSSVMDGLASIDDYELRGLDIVEDPEQNVFAGDLTDYRDIRPLFEDQDAVVHLARPKGNLNPFSTRVAWNGTLYDNLVSITNAFSAAVDAGVDKVIYSSSHHLMGMYEFERAPELYDSDDEFIIDHETPPRPDSMYAVTKQYAESMGRLMADAHDIQFYSLRLGNLRDGEPDNPYVDAEQGVLDGDFERGSAEYEEKADRLKASWLSRRDAAHLVDCCLQDDTVDFDTFYGISDNAGAWFDISYAQEVLGYEPQDDGNEWESPPN